MKFGHALSYVNLFCVGSLAGSSLAFALGLGTAMENLSAASYIEFHQALEYTFSCKLPFFYGTTLLLLALTLVIKRRAWRTLTFALMVCAFLCIADEMFMTVNVSTPLGKNIQSWQMQQLPQDWLEIRAQWMRFIYWRSALSVSAFILLLLSTGLDSKSRDDVVDVWEPPLEGAENSPDF